MNKGRVFAILTLIIVAYSAICFSVPLWWSTTEAGQEYKNEFYFYISQAKQMKTPDSMREMLIKADEGITKIGLEDSDHMSPLFFTKNRIWTVEGFRNKLRSIIHRCEDTMKWRDSTLYNKSTVESHDDVYEYKIRALRSDICELNERGIVRAYAIKNGFIFIHFWMWLILSILPFIWCAYLMWLQ